MSVSRTTRNRCALFTCVPGNSSWMFCADHVFDEGERLTRLVGRATGPQMRSGSGTKRGSRSGTFTRANFVRPLCRTTTAKL